MPPGVINSLVWQASRQSLGRAVRVAWPIPLVEGLYVGAIWYFTPILVWVRYPVVQRALYGAILILLVFMIVHTLRGFRHAASGDVPWYAGFYVAVANFFPIPFWLGVVGYLQHQGYVIVPVFALAGIVLGTVGWLLLWAYVGMRLRVGLSERRARYLFIILYAGCAIYVIYQGLR